MIINLPAGWRGTLFIVLPFYCLLYATRVHAMQQEYVPGKDPANSGYRYTWNSDVPPNYNDVLLENMRFSQTSVNQQGWQFSSATDKITGDRTQLGIGWSLPLLGRMITGPIMAYRWDTSNSNVYTPDTDNNLVQTGATDPLWHAGISSVGWRFDLPSERLSPWAQISYNHQYGDNQWKAQSGLRATVASEQEVSWTDMTVGANLPVGKNSAAFAAVSQTEGLSNGEDFRYTLGISAHF